MITTNPPIHCFIDTKFLARLGRSLNDEQLDVHFQQTTGQRLISKNPIYMVFNPVTIMEYAGPKLSGITNLPKNLRAPGDGGVDTWIEKLFRWFLESIGPEAHKALPEIKKEILNKITASPPGSFRKIFFEGMDSVLKSRGEEYLVRDLTTISLGSVMGGVKILDKKDEIGLQIRVLQFVFARIAKGYPGTVGKISAAVMATLKEFALKNGRPVEGIPASELLVNWKWGSDFGDEILVSSSLFGAQNAMGEINRVDCFTADDKDETIARLQSVKLTYEGIKSIQADRERQGLERLYLMPDLCIGRVHFLHSDFKTIECVNLAEVFEST